MSLPIWITVIEGATNKFVIDPDIVYPEWLGLLDVEKPDRYWLGVCLGCLKFDFDLHVRIEGKVKPGRSITRRIRADDGRKARWNLTMHPVGKVPKIEGIPVVTNAAGKAINDFDALPINIRSAHIRHHYKRIRGFIPTG